MSRRRAVRFAAAAATTLLTAAPVVALTATSADAQPAGYGPSDPFDDALMGDDGPLEPMKDQARINRTEYGYLLIAGQQNSHVTITLVHGGLRFKDTGTRAWRSLASGCKAETVATGVSALCQVPSSNSASDPSLIEVHPRLGNDFIDGRTLPATYELAVLADAGIDTVFTGSGNDFVNGANDLDRIHGGAGKDWIRGGRGNDRIWGDGGDDYIIGQDGADAIDGGTGANRIYR
jgi:serralysin